MNGANTVPLLTDSLGMEEDSNRTVHLQLSQPHQQNNETSTRATKLGYDMFHKTLVWITISNYQWSVICIQTYALKLQADCNCISEGDELGSDGIISIKRRTIITTLCCVICYKRNRPINKKNLVWNKMRINRCALWSKTPATYVKVKLI